MDALTDFLSVLVQGLLVLAIPILIAAAIPWLRAKANELRQRLTADQLAMLEQGVRWAVQAAEQAGISGQIADIGTEKKAYAIKTAQAFVNRSGLKVDVAEIAALIESEVHQQFKDPTPLQGNPEARSELIQKAIDVAVLASQQGSVQEFATRLTTGLLDSQKKFAVDFAMKYLEQYGIPIDRALVEGLIDAQVLRLRLQTLRARK